MELSIKQYIIRIFFFGNVQTSTLRKELKANMLTVYTEGLWSYSFELIASYKHS